MKKREPIEIIIELVDSLTVEERNKLGMALHPTPDGTTYDFAAFLPAVPEKQRKKYYKTAKAIVDLAIERAENSVSERLENVGGGENLVTVSNNIRMSKNFGMQHVVRRKHWDAANALDDILFGVSLAFRILDRERTERQHFVFCVDDWSRRVDSEVERYILEHRIK